MAAFDLQSLVRENIWKIKPYSSARDEYSGTASVFLDANENPYGSIDGGKNNRYPDPYQRALKQVVSSIKGIAADQIFLGVGSDEAIDLLFKTFCHPGRDKVIITSPTYGMYQVSAETNDADIIDVPLDADFQLETEKILNTYDPHIKMLFLCSPNNPSGNLLRSADIDRILQSFPGIVIIDEAYIDYTEQQSWLHQLDKYPNLVVLQTFSKAWGLANIRLGMMFASKELIALVSKIKLPYNISGMIQDYAIDVLKKHEAVKNEVVAKTKEQRALLAAELAKLPFVLKVYPSDANFILIKTTAPREIYTHLLHNQIVTRDRSKLKWCEGAIRITVGTAEENQQLIESIKKYQA